MADQVSPAVLTYLGLYLDERPGTKAAAHDWLWERVGRLKTEVLSDFGGNHIKSAAQALQKLIEPARGGEELSLWAATEDLVLAAGEEGELLSGLSKLGKRLNTLLLVHKERRNYAGVAKTLLAQAGYHRNLFYALNRRDDACINRGIFLTEKAEQCLELAGLRQQKNLCVLLKHQIRCFRLAMMVVDHRGYPERMLSQLGELTDLTKDLAPGLLPLETLRRTVGVHARVLALSTNSRTQVVSRDAGEHALAAAKSSANALAEPQRAVENVSLQQAETAFAENARQKPRFFEAVTGMADLWSQSRDALYLQFLKDWGAKLPANAAPVTRVVRNAFYLEPTLATIC